MNIIQILYQNRVDLISLSDEHCYNIDTKQPESPLFENYREFFQGLWQKIAFRIRSLFYHDKRNHA